MTDSTANLPRSVAEAFAIRISSGNLELPLLPSVTQEVLQLSFDENCDGKQLSELIHRDQSLASHLLRIANSPAYAPKDPIVSLQQAVTRLGVAKIREIALLVIANSSTFMVAGWESWIDSMFTLGLASGLYAKRIAKERRWNTEEAFLCGLLHGVGRPVILHALDEIYHEQDLDMQSAEATAGISRAIDNMHPRIGGALLKSWQLPVRLSDTVTHQYNYDEANDVAQTVAMTALATYLARKTLDMPMRVIDITQHPMLWPLNCYEDELEIHLEASGDIRAAAQEMAGAV